MIYLKHGLIRVVFGVAALSLTGCAVKPLKAPCSRNDAASATASFAFWGVGSNAPISISGMADSPSLAVSRLPSPGTCGPMRLLNREDAQ